MVDVLRIIVASRGPYRFERRSHPYAGPGWVRLGEVLAARPRITIDMVAGDEVAIEVPDD